MIPKPYAAFGHVIYICEAEANEVVETPLNEEGKYKVGMYYFIQGKATLKVKETGEILGDRYPGWLNIENNNYANTSGTLQVTYPETTQWVCIPSMTDKREMPNLESLHVKDETFVLPNGANLFLAKGTLKIRDKVFVGPSQIRVRTGNLSTEAIGEVFALKFL